MTACQPTARQGRTVDDGATAPASNCNTSFSKGHAALALLTALAISAVDLVLPSGISVIILFMIPIIIAGRIPGRGHILAVTALCALLNVSTFIVRHGIAGVYEPYLVRRALALSATIMAVFAVSSIRQFESKRREKRALVDLATDAIFVRGPDDIILRWSNGAERLYGIKANQAIGSSVGSLLAPTPSDVHAATIPALYSQGYWSGELSHHTADGRSLDMISRLSRQADESGQTLAIFEAHACINDRKDAERRLRDSADRYRRIFDGSGAAIWEEDYTTVYSCLRRLRDGGVADLQIYLLAHPAVLQQIQGNIRVLAVNDAARTLFGSPGETAFARLRSQTLATGTPAATAACFAALERGDRTFETETEGATSDGSQLFVVQKFRFNSGPSPRAVVSVIDVTERTLAEIQLNDLHDALARQSRAATLGALAVQIASDVRGQVSLITDLAHACVDLIGDDKCAAAHLTSHGLGEIANASRQAAREVATVRNFARRQVAPYAALDVAGLMESTRLLTHREAMRRGVTLLHRFTNDVGEIFGDRTRVEHLLVHLTLTAVRAFDQTSRHAPVVEISATGTDDTVTFTIRDFAGVGSQQAPASLVQQLLEGIDVRYLDELGTVICRGTLDAHGASHTVTVDPNGGTNQLLRFPRNLPA